MLRFALPAAVALAFLFAPGAARAADAFSTFSQRVAGLALSHDDPQVLEALRTLNRTGFLRELFQAARESGDTVTRPEVDGKQILAWVRTWSEQENLAFQSATPQPTAGPIQLEAQTCTPNLRKLRVLEARPAEGGDFDVQVVVSFTIRSRSYQAYEENYYYWLRLDPATGFVTQSERVGTSQTAAAPWAAAGK